MNLSLKPWQRITLHVVLIGGSLLFLLPYLWLLGTSWKLDKELQREEINIFPMAPIPRTKSPYIDERTFSEMQRPDGVGSEPWRQWIRRALKEEIAAAIDDWRDERTRDLPREPLLAELTQGVYSQLKEMMPFDVWSADEEAFRGHVRGSIKPDMIQVSFDQAYRFFALSKVLLKDTNYGIRLLTADRKMDDVWRVADGPAELRFIDRPQGRVGVVHYDIEKEDAFEIEALFPLGIDFDQFKRLSVSFSRDQTWHELRAMFEIHGKLYRSIQPKYLGKDDFWEASFQFPSEDDKRLMPRRYVLMEEVDAGPQYDHGRNTLKLRIRITRSSKPEAYWGKGTENYRKVFEEVPFWRYFKTSAFLAIANILGTCISCSLAAYAFARLRWPGRDLCFVLVLATLMIPPQVTMIPSFIIYKQLGWYNTLAPLWVPSCLGFNAFAIFLLRQAMKGLPRDLEDAAKIDGCGFFRTYWHVALPLMKPALAAISVFTFMYVWNDFMGPLIYVNDQRLYPLALGLFGFMAGREKEFTLIMSASVVMTLPVIITFFMLQRYFIQGVALTGMKN